MTHLRPFKQDRRVLLFPRLSSRRSMMWCPWCCDLRQCLKLPNTWNLPRSKPFAMVALPTSRSISIHKGVNQRSKYVAQVLQQRPESPTVTLTWHACKYKVYKLHQRYILKLLVYLVDHFHSQLLLLLLKCCFTSTETVGLLGMGALDVHLDFHTAPELCCKPVVVEILLYVHRNRRLIRDGSPGRPPRLSHSSWAVSVHSGMSRFVHQENTQEMGVEYS